MSNRMFFSNRSGAHVCGNGYPVLMGAMIPNGRFLGVSGQHYFRNTGDVWINVNGRRRWLKIVEV